MRDIPPALLQAPHRRISARVYTDPDELQAERDRVFGRAWIAAAMPWEIRQPGSWTVLDLLGPSILLVRGLDGRVRAFHNACRHRGLRLVRRTGEGREIACPYHGWRYTLDGRLGQLPRPEGLDGLLDRGCGLRPIRCASWAGFHWVNLDGPPREDDARFLAAAMGPAAPEVEAYRLDEMRPIQDTVFTLEANWKLVLENATDFYHVPVVHRRSIQVGVAGRPDFAVLGDHTRQRLEMAGGRVRGWLDRRCSGPGDWTDLQHRALHKFVLFPNLLVNLLPYHLTVMQVFPVEPGLTRMRYAFCRREGTGLPGAARAAATWLASRWILHEDVVILRDLQAGLAAGSAGPATIHREEIFAAHLRGVLDRWLGRSGTQAT